MATPSSSLLSLGRTKQQRQLVPRSCLPHGYPEGRPAPYVLSAGTIPLPIRGALRLLAFDLRCLPGGDKSIITKAGTTLEATGRLVESGGLIRVVVYVGHLGGREEYDTIREFSSGLSTDDWICCKPQMLNRPLAPILDFMNKR